MDFTNGHKHCTQVPARHLYTTVFSQTDGQRAVLMHVLFRHTSIHHTDYCMPQQVMSYILSFSLPSNFHLVSSSAMIISTFLSSIQPPPVSSLLYSFFSLLSSLPSSVSHSRQTSWNPGNTAASSVLLSPAPCFTPSLLSGNPPV